MSERWALLVHGGAKTIRAERRETNRSGCLAALEAGRAVLAAGGGAVEAVVASIRVLEDDPTFNAGFGAVLNSDGEVELDAAVMDGATLDVGSVAAVRGVRNPIEAAHALLREQPVMLVAEGAARFASEKGVAICDPDFHVAPELQADEACDTVGCVAIDMNGNMAAGTSTGGLHGVRPGRVGDSPIPGCGLAAENGVGAVAFSGDGESILRLTLAGRLMHDLSTLDAKPAADRAIGQMGRVGGEAGCIVLDARGEPGVAHNSSDFAFGFASADRPPAAYLHKDEFNDEQ